MSVEEGEGQVSEDKEERMIVEEGRVGVVSSSSGRICKSRGTNRVRERRKHGY